MIRAPFLRHRGDPAPLGDCRRCGRATWHADAAGPVHDCCARLSPGDVCEPCETTLELHRRAERWAQKRRRAAAA